MERGMFTWSDAHDIVPDQSVSQSASVVVAEAII